MEDLTRGSMNDIRQFLAGKAIATRSLTGRSCKRLKDELRFLQQDLGMEAILETEPEDVDLPEEVKTRFTTSFAKAGQRHPPLARVAHRGAFRSAANRLEGMIEDNGAGMNLTT